MLDRKQKLWIEREMSELFIINSSSFGDVSEFVDKKFQREVRIMALWRLVFIANSKNQREFVLSQSLKYDDVDLHFKALSSLFAILTDPMDVKKHYPKKYENNDRFLGLLAISLTNSLKCIVEGLDLERAVAYLKISNIDEDYKGLINAQIFRIIPTTTFEELSVAINSRNVFDETNESIWLNLVKLSKTVAMPKIAESISRNRFGEQRVRSLLKVACDRIAEASIVEAHRIYSIAKHWHFEDLRLSSLSRIEFLLPTSSIDEASSLCRSTISGTLLNKMVIARLRQLMPNADKSDVRRIFLGSVGNRELDDLLTMAICKIDSDIKIGPLE